MALDNYPAWNRLIGALVEVRQYGTIIRAGIVEDAMPDSSVLWLAADGDNMRKMYEAALDHQAWVEPQNLAGTNYYRMTTLMLYPELQDSQQEPDKRHV